MTNGIDWKEQHCGIIECTPEQFWELMPDVAPLMDTFPEAAQDFYWDVRVSMLMPGQYPAIPAWHFDHIPREGGRTGRRRFGECQPDLPMYMWLSGPPFTEFKDRRPVAPETWVKFSQLDSHRATPATEHCWRGFVRAVHRKIHNRYPVSEVPLLRRHSQVYLDAVSFSW